jgi:hypothetical protein
MSTQTQAIEEASATLAGVTTGGTAAIPICDRLDGCAAKLREHLRAPTPSRKLKDNYSLLESQIAELRRTLRPSLLRKLSRSSESEGEPRVYQIAAGMAGGLLAQAPGIVNSSVLMPFAETLRETQPLDIVELWMFAPMLKLAILGRLCDNLETEGVVSVCLRSLWAIEAVSWTEFVETAYRAEALLRRDPAGVYSRMDLATRDRYRLELQRLARRAKLTEEEIAQAALQRAERAQSGGNQDSRTFHIGYYLIGPGARDFRRTIAPKWSPAFVAMDLAERYPNISYGAGVMILIALVLAGFAWMGEPIHWWLIALLFIPASQAALEILNAAVSRLLNPRAVPSMDFAEAIPDDCKTLVVVPTLLLSEAVCAKLLKDLEIRYLANRDPNLYFALLTDFADADRRDVATDSVLDLCADGIRQLNERYGTAEYRPFCLLHRARRWNPQERKWMGYERKRGKLNDLNRLLLGHGNSFERIAGDLARLREIRFVITLDTDTQLPRDTAAKMVAAMAHPLNRPMLDPATNVVTEGYALLRPQVAITVESAQRSWIARIFSGRPGFDPYATSVSDVYHDLHGQASFTGKGIYDVQAFDTAVGQRFPENTILSHDLIEGEHARTGMINVELVEDYPSTYAAFSKRKHRWVRGDWQLLPWLFAHPPVPGGRAAKKVHAAAGRSEVCP